MLHDLSADTEGPEVEIPEPPYQVNCRYIGQAEASGRNFLPGSGRGLTGQKLSARSRVTIFENARMFNRLPEPVKDVMFRKDSKAREQKAESKQRSATPDEHRRCAGNTTRSRKSSDGVSEQQKLLKQRFE